jgi:hypothetical protein
MSRLHQGRRNGAGGEVLWFGAPTAPRIKTFGSSARCRMNKMQATIKATSTQRIASYVKCPPLAASLATASLWNRLTGSYCVDQMTDGVGHLENVGSFA